jgi:hypothetical protein
LSQETEGKSIFATLSCIDVSEHIEAKGRFNYLSWAHAVQYLKSEYPEATWEVAEYVDERGVSMPYMETPCGYFVKVTVNVDGLEMSHTHPVLDYQNKPIEKPNSFDINTAIARCLTKAIALHGLGLYVYAGEDLPFETEPDKPISDDQKKQILKLKKELRFDDNRLKLGINRSIGQYISVEKLTEAQAMIVITRMLDIKEENK